MICNKCNNNCSQIITLWDGKNYCDHCIENTSIQLLHYAYKHNVLVSRYPATSFFPLDMIFLKYRIIIPSGVAILISLVTLPSPVVQEYPICSLVIFFATFIFIFLFLFINNVLFNLKMSFCSPVIEISNGFFNIKYYSPKLPFFARKYNVKLPLVKVSLFRHNDILYVKLSDQSIVDAIPKYLLYHVISDSGENTTYLNCQIDNSRICIWEDFFNFQGVGVQAISPAPKTPDSDANSEEKSEVSNVNTNDSIDKSDQKD